MKNFVLGLVFIGAITLSAPAHAEHHEEGAKSSVMVTRITVNPSMEKQWKEAWSTIRETAIDAGYSHPTYVSSHRNIRWMVTPIANHGDIDKVFADRSAIYDDGGKAYKTAVAKLQAAEISVHSFVAHHAPELSYSKGDGSEDAFIEVSSYRYQSGQKDEMKSVLADYKKILEKKDLPGRFDVYWDGLGAEGPSVTVVSTAPSPVVMAEQDAAIGAALEDDKEMEKLFERFLKISHGATDEQSWMRPAASIIPASGQ